MPDTGHNRLRSITVIYWALLSYIIAALVWWFISLEKQNTMMEWYKVHQLMNTIDSVQTSHLYQTELNKIHEDHGKNKSKYIGEGATFFLFIIIGAAFVYRSFRRQFRMQQQQQNFMMAVTHELKTPISVARLNLETMQKYSLEPEKQKKLIRMTLEETARLNFLTNNILVSSQLEGGGYQSSHEELDFSDLLKDCIRDFRNRYPERNFIEQAEPDMEVKGDPLLLQMLINNLLENAQKYSPKESPVKAILKKEQSHVQLQIIDEGPGITEKEREKIFIKFYRIGNESTRKTQGTGLGLYLCSKIARDHNADIRVTNNIPQGANFTVTFYN
ncbi:MAG: two-component sensor histidine kinase [Bacteroidetes bacterium]|nr:two-component sensor histidine kinase [Bacteroidota bacterium]